MVCSKQVKPNGKIRDTKVRTYRRKCNVHLCIGECFEAYHGEAASVSSSSVSSSRSGLQAITASYAQEDIYNMDETGLFYRMPPSKTLVQGPRQGTKQYKDRITVAQEEEESTSFAAAG